MKKLLIFAAILSTVLLTGCTQQNQTRQENQTILNTTTPKPLNFSEMTFSEILKLENIPIACYIIAEKNNATLKVSAYIKNGRLNEEITAIQSDKTTRKYKAVIKGNSTFFPTPQYAFNECEYLKTPTEQTQEVILPTDELVIKQIQCSLSSFSEEVFYTKNACTAEELEEKTR